MTDPTLDAQGLFPTAPGRIRTWTRKRVDPLRLEVADIVIADIAHALARQCRYNGHCYGHLSVARHSLWVQDTLWAAGWGHGMRMWGLLHDATEAYLGDMVKPLKTAPEMQAFRDAEDRAEAVIAQAFGLPMPMPEIVHEADRHVTVEIELAEARDTWTSTPGDDERQFLQTYEFLRKGML